MKKIPRNKKAFIRLDADELGVVIHGLICLKENCPFDYEREVANRLKIFLQSKQKVVFG